MKTWLKRIGWSVLALLVVLGGVVLEYLHHGGQFRQLAPHFAGSCSTLPMQASAEDIQIDRTRGIAYLSYLDRRALVERKAVLGTVMLLDLNVPEPRPRAALANEPPQFRPHGMSLYRAGDGTQRLFVISHPPGEAHRIEVFEQTSTGAFAPLRTLRDPLLVSPNAILAVGPNQFYVANDSGTRGGLGRALELLLRRGLSTVTYFDGQRMRAVATGLQSAAGIAMSPDGSHVYVSETSGNRVAVFARNPASGELAPLERIELGSAPDNISVDSDGSVWIAAHAQVFALIRHFGDARRRSPTQVFRYQPAAREGARLSEVFLDDGTRISAGSVGAAWGHQLLIGSITERKVLLCRLP
ncbi:MAG: beta-propeller fold lactonase family protein [Steroidobacteraceae bacterium]